MHWRIFPKYDLVCHFVIKIILRGLAVKVKQTRNILTSRDSPTTLCEMRSSKSRNVTLAIRTGLGSSVSYFKWGLPPRSCLNVVSLRRVSDVLGLYPGSERGGNWYLGVGEFYGIRQQPFNEEIKKKDNSQYRSLRVHTSRGCCSRLAPPPPPRGTVSRRPSPDCR